jgi:hypothetical protein
MRIGYEKKSPSSYLMYIPFSSNAAISFSIIKPIDHILTQHKNFIISHL